MTAPPVPKRPHDKETIAYLAHITKYCEDQVESFRARALDANTRLLQKTLDVWDAETAIRALRAPRPFLTRLRYLITGKLQ